MMQPEAILIMVAVSGTFAHWAKRLLKGETDSTAIDYLVGEWRSSVLMFLSLLGALFSLHANGALCDLSEANIALAFMTGYTADSGINKECRRGRW